VKPFLKSALFAPSAGIILISAPFAKDVRSFGKVIPRLFNVRRSLSLTSIGSRALIGGWFLSYFIRDGRIFPGVVIFFDFFLLTFISSNLLTTAELL
jgi:hypothetical protein